MSKLAHSNEETMRQIELIAEEHYLQESSVCLKCTTPDNCREAYMCLGQEHIDPEYHIYNELHC